MRGFCEWLLTDMGTMILALVFGAAFCLLLALT